MEHVKKQDTVMHSNSPQCTVTEYAMDNGELNIGVAEITGRYPEQGYALNRECGEIGYILKGSGKLVTEQNAALFSAGDVVYVPSGEKYYWEGHLTVVLACAPAWHPAQHAIQ